MLDRERVKDRFIDDTDNHTMEILQDEELYRHLKFTDNGSQCYRFDIHTWPGALCVTGDMGTYVFSRIPDMFEFFRMKDGNWDNKFVINPGYWGEKLQAVDSGRGRNNSHEEFSEDLFAENVNEEYDCFCEAYLDDDAEAVVEAYPDDTQTRKQQLESLREALDEEVIACGYDGETRAIDAAMNFRWESDDGELKFDMCDFWDRSCTDYTFHYIWILYAIVWGIGEYDKAAE